MTRRWSTIGLALLLAGAVWTLPAVAQDGDAVPSEDEGDYDPDAPWVRLELSLTLVSGVPNKVKKGPTGIAQTFDPNKDVGLPTHLTLATAAYFDVKFFEWGGLGGYYWGWETSGTYRRVQAAEGVRLNSTVFAAGEQVRTRVTIQHAEISLRYVWFHTKRVHLWFGIGGAWGSYGITLESPTQRASTRIQTYFGPALTYSIAARLFGGPVSFFLTSGFSFSYATFPSVVTYSRTGFRIELGGGLEVTIALSVHNARITDLKGVTRDPVSTGYAHKRVSWSVIGLETGLAFSF